MITLTNAKHEAFAQAVANGQPATQAYLTAGYPESSPGVTAAAASRLLKHVKVSARIAELQARTSAKLEERRVLTKESVIAKMIEIRDCALKAGNHAAAARANELLGREVKVFVEKKDIRVRRLADLEDAELEEMLAEQEAERASRAQQGRPN